MQAITVKRVLMVVLAVFSLGLMVGCTTILGVDKSSAARNGDYYPTCLVRADRALDDARAAGKDRQCPDEFNALKDMVDRAYQVHLACNTAGACKMAEDAIAKIRALCPPGRAEVRQEAEPVLEPVPAAEPAPKLFKYCITLNLDFDIDKADIKPQFHDDIARVGDFMKKYPTTTATIEGHTDNVGTPEYNMDLSQRRAESVVTYLTDKFGIDRSRLVAKGYGLTRPKADNSTNEGKQINRRIEAIIDCSFDVSEIKPPDRLCMSLQVEFDSGSADIKSQYTGEIAKLGEYMKKYSTTTATIEGHTDNVGGYESNMRLSQKRAESVVAYLVKNFGIDSSRLFAKGYGPTRRIAYNSTPEGRQQNRRINAIVDCVIR